MKEFIDGYKDELIAEGVGAEHDLEEVGELNPAGLRVYLESNALTLEAMRYFKLDPKNLAKIVVSIGGAERYEFNGVELLADMVMARKHMVSASVTDPTMDSVILKDFLDDARKIFEGTVALPSIEKLGTLEWMGPQISVDTALGMMIQCRAMISHAGYIELLPGGDDTYFDYYPGEMDYQAAVMSWFLNDGPRMV